jgi:hypothetical protein
MGWNKNGSTVMADYLGQKVTGIVTESRVKYGGKVQYTLAVDNIFINVRNDYANILLVDEDNIMVDFGVINDVE